MDDYYPEDYYSFKDVRGSRPSRVRRFFRSRLAQYDLGYDTILGAILARVFGSSGLPDYLRGERVSLQDRVLDIGCGTGELLVRMAQVGFENVEGIDPFISEERSYACGAVVRKKRLREIEKEFDLLILNHALEHMPHPKAVFKHLSHLLAEDGLLLIRIPTVSSWAWETYRNHWFSLDAPRHLFLHSTTSIEDLASQNGLEVCRVLYDSHEKQFWGSIQYREGIPYFSDRSYKTGVEGSIFSAADLEDFRERAVELNRRGRGDQACFYLRRAGTSR